MTFDYEIKLLRESIEVNKFNQEKKVYEEIKILASEKSMTINEFYKAKNSDLQIDLELLIHSFEYSGEKELIFDDRKYEIKQSIKRKDGYTLLICQELKLHE